MDVQKVFGADDSRIIPHIVLLGYLFFLEREVYHFSALLFWHLHFIIYARQGGFRINLCRHLYLVESLYSAFASKAVCH